jgi:hypothetical protein
MPKYRLVFDALTVDKSPEPRYALYVAPINLAGTAPTRFNLSKQDLTTAMNNMGLSISVQYLVLNSLPGSSHTIAA